MSAPIPSFFKIRCVLVIISFLLFFMLIGMARRAFAECTGTQTNGSCVEYTYYCTDGILSSGGTLYSSVTLGSSCNISYGDSSYSPAGTHYCYSGALRKWTRSAGQRAWVLSASWPLNALTQGASVPATRVASPNDTSTLDCSGDCTDEAEDLAAQCGATGFTMVDEDTCSGRCNDCVQEAEAQCPSPNIIVWNEDGDCSYNCSADTDGDGWPDIDDPDDDNDGMDDYDDPCPTNSDPKCVKPKGPDSDGDGKADVSDPDADMDGDGIPNSEDDDDDGDGVPDVSDLDADPDGDGLLNWEDDDDDGDGIPDVDDPDADPDGDGKINSEDDDDDNDGVPDVEDPDNDKYHSNEPAYSVNSSLSEMLKTRFQQFLDDVKMSSLFSIPERIKQGVPSGGDSSLSVEMGETFGGTHVVEFSGWSQGLAALNAIIYTVCSGIAIRIIILKR